MLCVTSTITLGRQICLFTTSNTQQNGRDCLDKATPITHITPLLSYQSVPSTQRFKRKRDLNLTDNLKYLCFAPWPWSECEAADDLVMRKTYVSHHDIILPILNLSWQNQKKTIQYVYPYSSCIGHVNWKT